MYAVLQVPRLALQAVLRVEGLVGSRPGSLLPFVVVDGEAKKPAVLGMTAAAEREGVALGLSVPQALARCADLVVRHRSQQAEESVAELLLALAYSLAPRVELLSRGEALVDLRGARLEEALVRCGQIVDELAELGLAAGVGVAETWVMAGLAASRAEGGVWLLGDEVGQEQAPARRVALADFMEGLPIGAVGGSAGLLDVLEKWGVRTVAAFAGLKRSAVGARLGVEGLQLWDRVSGAERRVVAVRELPADFEESWEFEYDVDSLEPLLFLLNRFLDALCLRMRAGHKAAVLAGVELGLAYGEPIVLQQKLPEATSDAAALFALLAGRLGEVDADSPVARLGLRLEVVDFKQRQLGLFESSLKNPYRLTQTLARVAGIVGEEHVGRPVLREDGGPDGFRMEALPLALPPVGELDLGRMFGMPLRRYRPSLRAAVEFQGRVPVWVQCEEVSGVVKAACGPWLHSGHWWEEAGRWNRVEWDVELSKGGVYRISKDEAGWSVEGEY